MKEFHVGECRGIKFYTVELKMLAAHDVDASQTFMQT